MKPIARLATLKDRETGNCVGAKVNCRGHIRFTRSYIKQVRSIRVRREINKSPTSGKHEIMNA